MNQKTHEVLAQPFTTYYAITVKKTGMDNYCSETELQSRLDKLSNKRYPIETHQQVMELDSQNRLHAHLLVSSVDKLWIKPVKGWHIFQSEIPSMNDKHNWERYMHKVVKDRYSQEEILTLNESRNICLFE